MPALLPPSTRPRADSSWCAFFSAGPLWPPFQKIVTKLRNELLVALYSDYVEPTAAPPYLQRVPYHQLTKQLRAELGEMGARPAFGALGFWSALSVRAHFNRRASGGAAAPARYAHLLTHLH